MARDEVNGIDRAPSWVRSLIVVVVLALAAAAGIVGFRTYTERYRVSTGPADDVAVAEVVRSTFAGASDLKVATLSGTVQGVASSRSFGVIAANRVMKAPFEVEYFVDLSRMGPSDFLWNAGTKTLTIHPPDVRVGTINVDEARTYLDRTDGLFVTRGAMAEMQHQASAGAERVARVAAAKPDKLAAARDSARGDLQRLLGGPFRAAGLGAVTVRIVFPGEGTRSSDRWDTTRAIPEVLNATG